MRNLLNPKPITLLIITLALVAGCSDDSSITSSIDSQDAVPTEDDYQIIAEDIAYAITNPDDGLLALSQPVPPMEGPGGEELQIDRLRDFSNLHDTTFTHNGFTTTIDVTFFDADDNPSEIYDPQTSVRLLRDLTMEGEHSDEFREVFVDLQSALSMNNILETDSVRVINDVGTRTESGTMQGRLEDQLRTWNADHDWVTTDLNIHVDYETYPYPLSGNIYHHTLMEKTMTTGQSTRTVTMEVGSTTYFDGTNLALVVMDNGDEFYIDLDDGGAQRRPPRP